MLPIHLRFHVSAYTVSIPLTFIDPYTTEIFLLVASITFGEDEQLHVVSLFFMS